MADPTEQSEKLNALAQDTGLVETNENGNGKRPHIRVPSDQRELIDFCRECGAELAKEDRLFRRDRTPVAVNHEKARLDPISPRAMCSFAQRYIRFFKFKTIEIREAARDDQKKLTITVIKNIAVETAGKLLESWELVEKLPEIRRLNPTRLPVMREDRRIDLLKPGYFAEQGIYTLNDGIKYDETMDRDGARKVLDDLLKEFPFADKRSKAVAIAAMFTMFCATMLPKRALRPGFIYTGNAPGAGKTLLCKFAVIPVVGSCSVRTMPRRDETRKVLDALAMDASTYVVFDNVRGRIASEDIEAFITSPEWEGRVLGESQRFRVDNVATVMLTGNQSTTSADMADRCLFVELFVEEADNRDRVIIRPIDDRFLAECARPNILSAMWALEKWWEAEGRPKPPTIMKRFEQWSEIVGGIVYAAGYGDPAEPPHIPTAGDVELRDMHALASALAPENIGERGEWKFDQIVEKIQEHGLFEDTEIWQGRQQRDMFDANNNITSAGRSFFGKLLVRYDDRLFRSEEGRRLRFRVEGKGNTRLYVVIRET